MSRFDTSKEMHDTTFTLARATTARNSCCATGTALRSSSGHVGETVQTDTADGPIALRVDALTGAAGLTIRAVACVDAQHRRSLAEGARRAGNHAATGVIRASLEGGDSALTAAIVNSMAREFVRQDVASRSTEAEHTPAFLDQQLPGLRKELDEAEAALQQVPQYARHGRSRRREPPAASADRRQQDKAARSANAARRDVATLHGESPGSRRARCADRSAAGAPVNMNRSVAVMPDTEQTALRLLRDVHVDRSCTRICSIARSSCASRRRARSATCAWSISPKHPMSRLRPKRVIAILIALGGGLVLGIMLTLFKRAMYGGVERPDELEAVLGVPVFAVVPRSSARSCACRRTSRCAGVVCMFSAAGAGRHRGRRRAQSPYFTATFARPCRK